MKVRYACMLLLYLDKINNVLIMCFVQAIVVNYW